ncbi:EAL domain-containing protein, partial [Porticoccus sp.]
GSIDAAKRTLVRLGGEVVGEEYFPIGSRDFDELFRKLEKSSPDVFIPYAAGSDQVALLTRFNEYGLKDKMAVAMGHFDEVLASHLRPEHRQGFYSCNSYFMGVDTPENRTYLERLSRCPGADGIYPGGNGLLTNFGEGVYICIKAFAQAANSVNSVNTEKLLEGLEQSLVTAPQGMVRMDPATHHAEVNCYLARCRLDGSFAIEKAFGRIKPVIPVRHSAKMRKGDVHSLGDDIDGNEWEFIGVAECDRQRGGQLVSTKMHAASLLTLNHFLEGVNRHLCETRADLDNLQKKLMVTAWSIQQKYTGRVAVYPLVGGEKAYYAIYALLKGQRDIASLPVESPGLKPDLENLILDYSDIAIISVNEQGKIIQANINACGQFGYPKSELLGLSVHHLLPPHLREAHKEQVHNFLHSPVVEQRMMKRAEIIGYRKDGSFFPALATLSKFDMGGEVGVIATLLDISDKKKEEMDLQWRATHDSLTGLPNRSLITSRLSHALQRIESHNTAVAVMFIDLDNCKLVNDNYGHEVGDQLLVSISKRLLECVSPGVIVSRFGGDEFVVIIGGVVDVLDVEITADRLVRAFEQPLCFTEPQMNFYATISIGIAFADSSAVTTAAELLSHADAAMYTVKEKGRNGWRIFDQSISDENKLQIDIANGLRNCIANDELFLVYQPIIDAQTGQIVSTEALLRWNRSGNPISPAVFIPIAERQGLISEIGLWVFEQACMEQVRRSKLFPRGKVPSMSVNLSTRQLDDTGLVNNFRDIIERTGVNPDEIILEVTETALMSDIDNNLQVVNDLEALQLRFAVDDFGTGYSSLSQLMRMPVHTLKVDREFVDGIDFDGEHRTIVEAIIKMSHALGISVTAEGVETEGQHDTLKQLGCDFVQGFLFYKPVPAGVLAEALAGQVEVGAPVEA